jgi:hypothetical protein
LESRGLLNCPIVGVAVDDWTDDDLRARARSSIDGGGETIDEETFARLADRMSYVSGALTPPPSSGLLPPSTGARTPVFYLEIPPFLFGSVVKGLTDAGLTDSARVVVEKPFGHDVDSAPLFSVSRSMPDADPAHYVRGQYEGYRSITVSPPTRRQRRMRPSAWRSRTLSWIDPDQWTRADPIAASRAS